ncbi:MAG: PIN domain-containing protein [Spirochaetaceae bacterium]|jgi:predicted nucleic acid-binding protein|nr:PIN domain-containing protein [Spirochaetaceae bacterium]
MNCCCLNRPADDQTQDKIRIETDAIIGILFKCFYGSWKLIGSDIVEYEIMKTPDLNKLDKALNLYSVKKENVEINEKIAARALEVQKHGLKPLDSLHFASAEYRNVDVLLTVDKDFIKYSKK